MTFNCNSVWRVGGGRQLALGAAGHLMAIVNVTPDSFSDGGRHASAAAAVEHALTCVKQGAVILDIGGESTKPNADPVDAAEEQARVLPVIEALARQTDAVISVDTYRAETAKRALAAGAHIVNDVYGLQRDPDMARVVAEAGAGVVIMHTGRERHKLTDVIADQDVFLKTSIEMAERAGIGRDRIVLDPGFGFAKDVAENTELMARFHELQRFGLPLLAGTSRKRFIGAITEREAADQRDVGTAATTALLRVAGAVIFRVHEIPGNRDALRLADAVLAAQRKMRA
ncbi:dihydropteroate synthase [Rhizobium oryzicola]|uniref:Dihydropteroate synthase n=2 Tax=Rhizobium oryzicola TaxID=1232668 RepID=A0ABT8T1B8_9HYPH|nr:dihydropteroate synthase [Rhizobium oryzicola]MDO1584549.1 dihydropteroate synthase [Rhizobium oryzicola]